MKKVELHLLSAILLVLASFAANAQDTAVPAESAPEIQRVLVAMDLRDVSPATKPHYARGMQIALTRSGTPVSLSWFEDGFAYGDVDSERAVHDLAIRMGSRFTVSCRVLEREGEAEAVWTVRDVALKLDYPEARSTMKNPTFGSIVDYFWLGAVESVSGAAAKPVPEDHVVLRALPGSVVEGFTKKPLRVGESGELDIPVQIPKPYVVVVRGPGALPTRLKLLVDRPGMEIDVPQESLPRMDLEAGLYRFQYPDFKFRYWIPKTPFFASASLEQFMVGFTMNRRPGPDGEIPPWWGGIPLIEPGLGGGMDFSLPSSSTGIVLGGDVFMRLFFPMWSGVAIDPAAPVGVRLYISFEQNLVGNMSFFTQFGSVAYPFTDRELVLASMGDKDSAQMAALIGPVLVEFFTFRCGVRWELR